ncbi:XRE family transcriptional regulator [Paraburkholderia caballeronis]|uniref:helix-turn-helix domain-containing protein n=1 Tax=Paraburkholderia caballeronis TaxID=416943 RepID=UPI00106611BF|nr:XRE family transcriptional regulator [Paraburkholderia caballeronis]TDV24763.1 XRE family transcriptional regulator [Paraburkholderia caballeronis]
MDVNLLLARRVRALRAERGLSLDALAERSGVSRSAISLIERGESSPTAAVLDRLATALGVALASLFDAAPDDADPDAQPSPLSRAATQPVWTDPESGYTRRNLSASADSPLQLVEVRFPAGQRVAYDTGPRDVEIHQQVWVVEGAMELTVAGTTWRLETGDCLSMRVDAPIVFSNPGRRAARYLVALTTVPSARRRRPA